ncbi:hypothetical protein EIP91_003656 [Steccherinum ochraceum]|uniref:Uncharacterized protein n=1 Tax=Steccherinum ochraceum TaxID=92696 RepID=A0A4R0RGF7_9APHY|nr:hypothetical protein EIP91_003656 [Steccherinum ochraceum]
MIDRTCKTTTIFAAILTLIKICDTSAFTTLRVWAIWNHSATLTIFVFITNLIIPCVNLYYCIKGRGMLFRRDETELHQKCLQPLYRTTTFGPPKLTTLLLRDGSLYFCSRVVLNTVALLLNIFLAGSRDSTTFIFIVDAVTTNLVTRFILDLRSIYQSPDSMRSTIDPSNIRFNVRSMAGNMGAPLNVADSTWFSGAADEVEETYEQADEPFCAGLEVDAIRDRGERVDSEGARY